MKNFVPFICCAALLSTAAQAAPARPAASPALPPPPLFTFATIGDIGRPFTVIDTICVFRPLPKTAATGDPLEVAMGEAFGRVRELAASRDREANGLIGYDIDFTSPEGKEPGRLLLCGTLVKIR